MKDLSASAFVKTFPGRISIAVMRNASSAAAGRPAQAAKRSVARKIRFKTSALRGFPQRLRLAPCFRGPSRKNEEKVREPVQVHEALASDGFLARERGDDALGPAADRARLVQERAHESAARQDEGLQLRQPVVQLVDRLLDPRHVTGLDYG